MQYLPVLAYHAQFQCLGCGRKDGEARFAATEHGTFDRLHFAAERTGRVRDVVDVAARHVDVLEVVDVSVDVHIHPVTAQDGVYTLLQIESLNLVFVRIGIDGMVSDHNDPVFLRCSQGCVEPLQLSVDVLEAGIGIFVVFLPVSGVVSIQMMRTVVPSSLKCLV